MLQLNGLSCNIMRNFEFLSTAFKCWMTWIPVEIFFLAVLNLHFKFVVYWAWSRCTNLAKIYVVCLGIWKSGGLEMRSTG
ncbi:hypothetical protein RIF29_12162 [Crotalaria pallida]|uniref:Uncharacterized protein n=1 Tax=Crotalaria pallida TaxID=3830 RepID=A0AAN9IN16_CROPI